MVHMVPDLGRRVQTQHERQWPMLFGADIDIRILIHKTDAIKRNLDPIEDSGLLSVEARSRVSTNTLQILLPSV